MGKFDEFILGIQLLVEKKRNLKTTSSSKVNNKSNSNRKNRAKNVKITNHETSKNVSNNPLVVHTCNAESDEKTESVKHICRVEVVAKSGKVASANCSCSDFQSRYQYYRNKDGVSDYNRVVPIKDIFKPHTKDKPKKMNPKNDGYMCKHLISFINKIKKT